MYFHANDVVVAKNKSKSKNKTIIQTSKKPRLVQKSSTPEQGWNLLKMTQHIVKTEQQAKAHTQVKRVETTKTKGIAFNSALFELCCRAYHVGPAKEFLVVEFSGTKPTNVKYLISSLPLRFVLELLQQMLYVAEKYQLFHPRLVDGETVFAMKSQNHHDAQHFIHEYQLYLTDLQSCSILPNKQKQQDMTNAICTFFYNILEKKQQEQKQEQQDKNTQVSELQELMEDVLLPGIRQRSRRFYASICDLKKQVDEKCQHMIVTLQ